MRVVKVRGTGEHTSRNMLSLIDGDELDYRPEIRPIGTQSYTDSVKQGRAALARIDAKGEPYILVGYSLGACVAGNFTAWDHPKNCRGVVLVADPLRARGQVTNKGVPANRFGIAGERRITTVPVASFAIPDDPIGACPDDNGGRWIADRVTGLKQPIPAQWWNAGYTIQWLSKYLTEGRHTAYGTETMPGTTTTYMQAARDAVQHLT